MFGGGAEEVFNKLSPTPCFRLKDSHMTRVLLFVVAAALSLDACTGSSSPQARASPSSAPERRSIAGSKGSEGWYSVAQADQGAALFKQKCGVCHGANLQGGAGPQLAGNQFFLRYKGKPLSALWSTIHTEMPLTAPATLSDPQSLALVAFILQKNGFSAGASPIVGYYDVYRIIPAAAPGSAAAAETASNSTTAPIVVKQPTTAAPTQQELDKSDEDADGWLTYGKGYRGARYPHSRRLPPRTLHA